MNPNGIGTGHVANCVKQVMEGAYEGNYVLGHCISGYGWFHQVGVKLKC